MLTIPARVWMKILSLSESYDKVKQQKAEIAVLFTAAQEKTKSSDDSSGEEAGENEFQKLVRYLESEADERIAPGSAAAQQICEHPNDKLDASHEGGSDCGSIMHSASASANEVSIGIDQEEELKGMDSGVMDNQPEEQRPIGSKKTLKKRIQRRRKKEQLKLQEERLREETQNLATASESTDLSAVTRSEPVALNQQPSDTSPTELTDCASFTTAPLSPSSSPQRSGSFQSLEYHTPPPSTDSSSRPLQPAQPSHEIVAAFVRKVQETRLPGKQPPSSIPIIQPWPFC